MRAPTFSKTQSVSFGFLLGSDSLSVRFQKITLATTPLLHYSIYRVNTLLPGCTGPVCA